MLPGYSAQVPPTHQADLSHQLGQLSLQDPAFIQELQRLENQKYQYGAVQPLPAQHDPANTGMFPAQVATMPPMPLGPNTLPSVPMGGAPTGGSGEFQMIRLTMSDHIAAPGSQPFVGNILPPSGSPSQAAKTRSHDEVAELAPEEVRWFYKVEPEKGWVRFNGYDSLRIEIRYRHIWQTRWRSHSSAHTRRAHSLNREAGTFSLQL